MSTRPATPADLHIGNIVYKGNGKTRWVITNHSIHTKGAVGLAKETSKNKQPGNNAEYHYTELRVDDN